MNPPMSVPSSVSNCMTWLPSMTTRSVRYVFDTFDSEQDALKAFT